jgi:hypothetical protein
VEGIYVLVASVLPISAIYKLLGIKIGAKKALDFAVKAKSADFMELESPTKTILIDTSHFRDEDGNLVLNGQTFGASADGKILITASETVLEGLVDELGPIIGHLFEEGMVDEANVLLDIENALLWEMKRRRETPSRKIRPAAL